MLANMATGYLLNASSHSLQVQLGLQLQQAIDSRVVIEQAKGVLVAAEDISLDAAFERIRRHARNHNAKIGDVARVVVTLGLRL